MVNYALIGSGWRAEFYIRIAKALPDHFNLTSVLIRDHQKGVDFSRKFEVPVCNTLDALMHTSPDFVVLAVKRGITTEYLLDLFDKQIPVMTETPPGESKEDLVRLWESSKAFSAKVQVAEQYFLQPLYASWKNVINEKMLGEITNMSISSLHGYHGVAMIRYFLETGFENCKITGKRYHFPVTETYGREGMCFDGVMFSCPRDRATLEFENGKVCYFDFSDPAQYHSFIRTRQLNIQGTRGEIDDLTVRYLTENNVPVTENLNRIDLGVYGNQEWSHYGIMLGERMLYRSPYKNARLNDDEIAVASLLDGMEQYMRTGKDIYSLRNALQDMYLNLMMEDAYKKEYAYVETSDQPWKNN